MPLTILWLYSPAEHVSAGAVEGQARVLTTPDFAAVKAGEILVAPSIDPSWSSVMFIAGGLVIDIGGALSHAAVVAREMGQPCVVNTRSGTLTDGVGRSLDVSGEIIASIPWEGWHNAVVHLALTRWTLGDGAIGWGDSQDVQWNDHVRAFHQR